MKVKIYDAIMGSGKTHDAIIRMKQYLVDNKKFIYITPFLAEIERVKYELPMGKVFTPMSIEDNGGKYVYDVNTEIINENGVFKITKTYERLNKRKQFLKAASQGKNIISTHALFMSLKREDFELFSDYILILDEVVDPLQVRDIGARDIEIMKDQDLIIVDDDDQVRFIDDEYRDKAFNDIKYLCNNSTVYHLDKYFFVWVFPIEIFKEFKEIQILTYFFEGSLLSAYFKMHGVSYNINASNSSLGLLKLKGLLNIYTGTANQTKGKLTNYSKTWIENNNSIHKKIAASTENIFKKVFKTKSSANAFTTFKIFRVKLKGKRYASGFISINARATNDFRHKKSMAYLGNRYFTPQERNFFNNRGIQLDEDKWALSELIQWVWRGCIRDNKPMNLFIPSLRMRNLLKDWLDGKTSVANSKSVNKSKKKYIA